MTVKEIKELPDTFKFKSKINPFDIVYLAEKDEHGYKVSWSGNKNTCHYTRETFYGNLLKGNFVICE